MKARTAHPGRTLAGGRSVAGVFACLLAGTTATACGTSSSSSPGSSSLAGGTLIPTSSSSAPISALPTPTPSTAGRTWSPADSVDPGLDLLSVSCPSPTDCVAVDSSAWGNAKPGNALTYNGSASAVPEPSTLAMLCGGGVLLFYVWRRRAE